jgi:hypothetical protein
VRLLDRLFSQFDELVEKVQSINSILTMHCTHYTLSSKVDLHKMDTVGDAYIAIAGLQNTETSEEANSKTSSKTKSGDRMSRGLHRRSINRSKHKKGEGRREAGKAAGGKKTSPKGYNRSGSFRVGREGRLGKELEKEGGAVTASMTVQEMSLEGRRMQVLNAKNTVDCGLSMIAILQVQCTASSTQLVVHS